MFRLMGCDMDFESLFGKKQSEIKLNLDRMVLAKERLFPEDLPIAPTILVGGTNGKGACAGLLWHLCSNVGIKAGLYSSPHIFNYSERFQISGDQLSPENISVEISVIRNRLGALYESLSFFEISTLLAVWLFQKGALSSTF